MCWDAVGSLQVPVCTPRGSGHERSLWISQSDWHFPLLRLTVEPEAQDATVAYSMAGMSFSSSQAVTAAVRGHSLRWLHSTNYCEEPPTIWYSRASSGSVPWEQPSDIENFVFSEPCFLSLEHFIPAGKMLDRLFPFLRITPPPQPLPVSFL